MACLIDITGKALSGEWGEDDAAGSGIPVLRTTNFSNEGIIDFSNVVTRTITKKRLEEKYLRPGDIIIEKSGGSDKQPVGRVVFFDGPEKTYLFNNFTALLRVKDTKRWLPRYIFYSLFAQWLAGGTRPFENRTTGLHNLQVDAYLKSVSIADISPDKQRHICHILDTVRNMMSCRKQQLSALDELVKARFEEMFGDPIANPKAWPTKSLLEIGTCKNGMNFHHDDSGVEIHCLGVSDFKDRSIVEDTTTLPKVSLNEMPPRDYLLQDGDIVFVRSNGNKALVGRTVAVYPGSVPTTFSGFCIRFRQSDSSVSTPYLLRVLKTDSMRLKMAGRGANIQNLNQQILSELGIPLPPLSTQKAFNRFVEIVDRIKSNLNHSINIIHHLFDKLIQDTFGNAAHV